MVHYDDRQTTHIGTAARQHRFAESSLYGVAPLNLSPFAYLYDRCLSLQYRTCNPNNEVDRTLTDISTAAAVLLEDNTHHSIAKRTDVCPLPEFGPSK